MNSDSLLNEILATLKIIAERQNEQMAELRSLKETLARKPERIAAETSKDKVRKAILLLTQYGPNKSKIAQIVKVSRVTMYRSAEWAPFRKLLKEYENIPSFGAVKKGFYQNGAVDVAVK